MRKNIASCALIATLASILLLANTFSFAEAQASSIRYKGQSADAYWDYEDNGIYTDVFVWTSQYATQQKSDRYTESGAYVGIYQYKVGDEVCNEYDGEKYCWHEYIPIQEFFGYTTINSEAFKTQGRLDGATLDATITGYNYLTDTPQERTIAISVKWTGEGDYSSGNSNYHYHSSNYMYNGHYVGLYRQATATASISGDITMNLSNSM
ncbi:MAG: hypothetical protein ACRD32_08135 [Nitrososphaerales archaeon]